MEQKVKILERVAFGSIWESSVPGRSRGCRDTDVASSDEV